MSNLSMNRSEIDLPADESIHPIPDQVMFVAGLADYFGLKKLEE